MAICPECGVEMVGRRTYMFCNTEGCAFRGQEFGVDKRTERLFSMAKLAPRLVALIEEITETDPGVLISGGGHTMLDSWRYNAKRAVEQYKEEVGE